MHADLAQDLTQTHLRERQSGPHSVAVVLPCLNEALAIVDVIAAFKRALPQAAIYVIDNGSSDATVSVARGAGAIVISEGRKGKGNAVRRAFAGIDADVYVIADGDGTYDAAAAPDLIDLLLQQRLDMVVATRRQTERNAFPAGHQFGNRLFNGVLRSFFGSECDDVFSGYRVLSRRFVSSFPALSDGFEIETEMTVHALMLRMPVAQTPCDYVSRPPGSVSKLRTYRDGVRIMWSILQLLRQHRPLFFFGCVAAACLITSAILFYPILTTYLATGLVPRFPTLIVCVGLVLLSGLMLMCGLILDTTIRTQLEIRRQIYLGSGKVPVVSEPMPRR